MTSNRFHTAISIFLVVVLGYLTYQILQPFVNAIAWALVFAIVFYPVYTFILRFMRVKALSSVVTLLVVVLVIIGPFTYFTFVLADEIGNLLQSVNKDTIDSMINLFAHSRVTLLFDRIQSYMGLEGIGSAGAIVENIRTLGRGVVSSLSAGIGNAAGMVVDFVLMMLTLFFFLKDGGAILTRSRAYLPFSEEDKSKLISRGRDMIISTVYGGVLIAVVQGFVGGIGFYFLGIKSPVLWGCAMTIMSFLPLIGTFSIWGPAVGYLFIIGSYGKGIILLLYGFLVITMVDNILRPIIVSGRTKMPALAVFFSVLGGIKFFGPIGFIMGPLVLALFVSVFEIFRNIEGGANA